MSWDVQKAVEDRTIGSATKKSILMFFAARASDDGSGIWTAKQRMADRMELNVRTVQKSIKDLIEAGLVSETGFRPCARGFTVEYRINLERLETLDPTGGTRPPLTQCHPTPGTAPPLPPAQGHPNNPLEITHEITLSPIVPKTDIPVSKKKSIEERFDLFWAEVPKKAGKPSAQRAFANALKKTDFQTIVVSMQKYQQHRQGQDPQFTLHPATWLNDERWNDEPGETPNNFHDKIKDMINGNQTGSTNPRQSDHVRAERMFAPMDTAREHDGRGSNDPDQTDVGRYQSESASILRGFKSKGST